MEKQGNLEPGTGWDNSSRDNQGTAALRLGIRGTAALGLDIQHWSRKEIEQIERNWLLLLFELHFLRLLKKVLSQQL